MMTLLIHLLLQAEHIVRHYHLLGHRNRAHSVYWVGCQNGTCSVIRMWSHGLTITW